MQCRAWARTSLPATGSDALRSRRELPSPPAHSRRTEGSTLQQVFFAATGTCPLPIWVGCWSGSQHHFSRKRSLSLPASILLISDCVLKVPPARASHQPASCCSQSTLLPNTHTSQAQVQLHQGQEPPGPHWHGHNGRTTALLSVLSFTPCPPSAALPCSPFPPYPPYFLLYTYNLIFTPTI